MNDSAPAIHCRSLARTFGDTRAVDSLDLEVARGAMFSLVGPDGAGKSTAIRLLTGILKPTGGEAAILGFDLLREPEGVKARIGYLSQEFTLYGDLTIDENIEFFADLHGVEDYRKRRDELLDFTRLAPFRQRLAGALSGGMKKKLALACTLIHTPDLIFLDEPSTGVDPVSRGEFWNILSGILDQGVTIFMTSPYLDEAERCDRVALMHRGRILMSGTPEELKDGLPGVVWEIRCGEARRARDLLRKALPGAELVLYGDRLNVYIPGESADASALRAPLEAAGIEPESIEVIPPSLEDVFVARLGSKEE
jgi:ABC-2 type transport system ATP-binding protein